MDQKDHVSEADAPASEDMVHVAENGGRGETSTPLTSGDEHVSEADAPASHAMQQAPQGAGATGDNAGEGADDGHASEADAPASDDMVHAAENGGRLGMSTPLSSGDEHVSEADAPASGAINQAAQAMDAAGEGDGSEDDGGRASEADAPASGDMGPEGHDGQVDGGGSRPGPEPASQTDAPASDDMTRTAGVGSTGSSGQAVPDGGQSGATGEAAGDVPLPGRIAENIQRIEELSQRLMQALARRPLHVQGIEGPGTDFYAAAATGWMRLATQQPARLIEHQVRYWGDTLRNLADTQSAFMQRGIAAPAVRKDDESDKRFSNPLWRTNPFFAYVREQYRINAEALRRAAADLPIEDAVERRRIEFFTRQMIDMMAPTNFLATNPDALARAIETEGESLVRGLENLVADIEHGGGELVVSLSDRDAFAVGQNIGATPGAVVHREDLFELIQYSPTTEQVHAVPLVILPPWINKFYILDLKPQNSLIRWLVDKGYTLFVVSWKNPTREHANVGMEDYVAAYLSAFQKIRDLTEQPQLNAVGYCIAGTTLSMTLGLLAQRGDDQVRSASFFTTLTDFSEMGEFTTYLQDDFLSGIEEEVQRAGYLASRIMQRTFSFLRANDLVWGPAVRHYMMGDSPPAFDLLYWNGDGTNLPARMVTDYLRGVCQENKLATEGFEVLGHKVRLSEVTVPVCAVACEGDHIAPWVDSWRGVSMMGSHDKTFLLSESGHIAGIVNPPGREKYGHYIGSADDDIDTPEDWKAKAAFHKGSWWPVWEAWLARQSGDMVAARHPSQVIEAAPGSYVRELA